MTKNGTNGSRPTVPCHPLRALRLDNSPIELGDDAAIVSEEIISEVTVKEDLLPEVYVEIDSIAEVGHLVSVECLCLTCSLGDWEVV